MFWNCRRCRGRRNRVVGARATVETGIAAFLERTGVDGIILASAIFDRGSRVRPNGILAEAMAAIGGALGGASGRLAKQ